MSALYIHCNACAAEDKPYRGLDCILLDDALAIICRAHNGVVVKITPDGLQRMLDAPRICDACGKVDDGTPHEH